MGISFGVESIVRDVNQRIDEVRGNFPRDFCVGIVVGSDEEKGSFLARRFEKEFRIKGIKYEFISEYSNRYYTLELRYFLGQLQTYSLNS